MCRIGKNGGRVYRGSAASQAQPGDILIDDHTPNLHRWEAAGGTGIKWLNQVNGNNGCFEAPVAAQRSPGQVLDKAQR
ncbi:MAG: hypothetical protein ACLUD2_15645 [Clostridium sp.]